MRRERARRCIFWQGGVQISQAFEVSRAIEYMFLPAVACNDALCAKPTNLAHATMSIANDCAMAAQVHSGNSGKSRRHAFF